MKKIAMSVAAATMLVGGLTACGDNQSTDPNATEFEAQNLNGYNNNGYNGNYTTSRYRNHEGPLTDMLTPDGYRNGNYGQFDGSTRAQSENYNNMTRRNGSRANSYTSRGMVGNNLPGMVDNDGLLRGRARDGSMNGFNGTRNGQNGTMRNRGFNNGANNGMMQNRGFNAQNNNGNYHENYDSSSAQRIVSSVTQIKGVNDARVIVHNDDIVVGVESNKDQDKVRKQVEDKVKGLAKGKNVHVVTDTDAVGRIRTMDDRLRTGSAFEEIGDTFTDMLRDIGSAARRPFEGAR